MCISAIGLKTLVDPRSREIMVFDKNGDKSYFDPERLLELINLVCRDIADDSKLEALYSRIEYSIYGGMTDYELKTSIINAAKFYARFDNDFRGIAEKLVKRLNYSKASRFKPEIKLRGFSSVVS